MLTIKNPPYLESGYGGFLFYPEGGLSKDGNFLLEYIELRADSTSNPRLTKRPLYLRRSVSSDIKYLSVYHAICTLCS